MILEILEETLFVQWNKYVVKSENSYSNVLKDKLMGDGISHYISNTQATWPHLS